MTFSGIKDRVLGAIARGWVFMEYGMSSELARARTRNLVARLKDCGSAPEFYWPITIEGADKVEVGSDVSLGSYLHVWGQGGVRIGDRTMVASHVCITSVTHDHAQILMRRTVVLSPVTIGSDVWIGAGAIILPGVTLGNGSVVAAGAVVTTDVLSGDIVTGVPARVMKSRVGIWS